MGEIDAKRKSSETAQPETRLDPDSGLPLPNPYPEYLPCPHCREPEVEAWSNQTRVQCHNCGEWFDHIPADDGD